MSSAYAFSQRQDLPIVFDKGENSKYLVFYTSGDGGLGGFNSKMANEFKAHQLSYISLNALNYFWSAKTPDQYALDMTPMLRHYLQEWDRKELVLVGFSFGAEVIPFLYTRLPDDLKQKVKRLILITPASTSDFKIHFSDMMGVDHTYAHDVVKEIEKIRTARVLAIFGEEESSSFPITHKQDNFQISFVKGSHHFTDAKTVMEMILNELKE